MSLPNKINHYLEIYLPVTTPLSIVMGFLFSSFFSRLGPFVLLLFGIMTFSGALKLRVSEFGKTIRSPKPIILFFISAHMLMPLIGMASSSFLIADHDVVAGFILLFASPTAVSGFIWVLIFRGDIALCLTLILFDTLLAPIVVPGTISILMGAKVAMDMTGIAVSLIFMIVVPTVIGVAVNETSKGKIPEVICPWFDPFAKICLMTVIATNASIIAPNIKFSDPLVWKVAAVTLVLTFLGFLMIKLVSDIGKCKHPKGSTLIVSGGLRNNIAVMTLAVTFFPHGAVYPTLMSILMQQSIMAIIGKIFIKIKTVGQQSENQEQ
jgi:tagaturonate reductase